MKQFTDQEILELFRVECVKIRLGARLPKKRSIQKLGDYYARKNGYKLGAWYSIFNEIDFPEAVKFVHPHQCIVRLPKRWAELFWRSRGL